jgi:hypothetical protein
MHFATRARARLRLRLTIRPAIFAFWSVITVAELILQCCALGAMRTGVFPVCASERKKMGAKLRLWSRAAAGTEVELTVPGHVAFQSHASARPRQWLTRFNRRPIAREAKKAESEQQQ